MNNNFGLLYIGKTIHPLKIRQWVFFWGGGQKTMSYFQGNTIVLENLIRSLHNVWPITRPVCSHMTRSLVRGNMGKIKNKGLWGPLH